MATVEASSTASPVVEPNSKVRVFGPKLSDDAKPTTDFKAEIEVLVEPDGENEVLALKQTPTNEVASVVPDAPSTPIPPVPSQGEVAAAQANAASAMETPAEISDTTELAAAPLPERSTEIPAIRAAPVSAQSGIPLQNASRTKIVPDNSGESPPDQNKGKKPQAWKSTPPERRKTITMEDKTSKL